MMYSDKDIAAAIEDGSIVIEPFDSRVVRPAGITMHLGENLLKPLPGRIVDVKSGSIPDYEEIVLTDNRPYELSPGEFLLGHTFEAVSVGSNLGFFIEGRSTLARVGLTIVQTAMLVYPGHRERTVTLELANHGPNAILLYPRMKIARVALFELKSRASEDYDTSGKYKDQVSVGRPIFKNEILASDS